MYRLVQRALASVKSSKIAGQKALQTRIADNNTPLSRSTIPFKQLIGPTGEIIAGRPTDVAAFALADGEANSVPTVLTDA